MSVAVVLLGCVTGLVAVLVVRRIIQFLISIRHMKLMTKDVPSPPAYPIIGSFQLFNGDPEDLYDKFMRMAKDYGPTVTVWLGHVLFFLVTNPADIEVVMTNPKFMNKSFVYHSTKKLMGHGLANLNGQVYRRHRKAITPSLHLDILNEFVEIFNEESSAFADHLGKLADSESVFDVKPLCGYCANSAVCRTVLSTAVSDDECNRSDFVDNIMPAQALFMYRIWRPWLLNDWLFSWTSKYSEFCKSSSLINKFVKTVLDKKTRKDGVITQPQQMKKRLAFLDHMLSSKEGAALTKDELFEEVKTISTIASGSSMDALAFLCYTLALRPDMQHKVQQEVDDIFGNDDTRPVVPSDLPHLEFTERFIKEVFRYFAVVPVFARNCPEDFKLPSGYTAPKGCQIAFFLPAVHMNPDIFPEPQKFDPNRFLPEVSRSRHPFSFVPFSAGPRNCIGQRYAMMFMKTTLANLVRRIEFLRAPDSPTRLEDVKLKMDLTLSVRFNANIRVQKRFPKSSSVSVAG